MKKQIIISLIACLGIFYSCERDYSSYEGSEHLEFGPDPSLIYGTHYAFNDTAKSYSFVYEGSSVTQDTVYFDLYATGGIKDFDRPIKLVQENVADTLNAQPGVHYVAFDNPEVSSLYVIKAGEAHLSLPVILKRDTSLTSRTYVLKLALDANKHFGLGDSRLLWRKVYFSDILERPNKWRYLERYLGKYSNVKHRFMIDATGKPWNDEFLTEIMADMSYMLFWAEKCKLALAKYPDAPLIDEDGELVVFP
ncbi:MAG: DUF4843 domain-containing protein [Bacteroidales bacterium]